MDNDLGLRKTVLCISLFHMQPHAATCSHMQPHAATCSLTGIKTAPTHDAFKTSVLKKGSRNKPENYRPVSLTSVVCKLLETLIRDHMVEFLVKHKLINTSQHGFLKARLCLINLLCFFGEITKWVDDGSPVDVVYLDFQKASNKVPHQKLLQR